MRVYLPKDLRSSDSRHTVRKTIQEVQRRFPHGLPQLDPAKDMKIKEEEFLKIVKVWTHREISLSLTSCPTLGFGIQLAIGTSQ